MSVKKAAKELRISTDELDERLRRAGIAPVRFGGQDLLTREQLGSINRS